ncbi:uncharacterized protein LOC142173499 [Nicotiana tabacum]|uniref:Uncharacterized protein LOC142173499 n=1 Tax=Nicotiana tabacum TaxID=4097 RepID=A0AC58TD94_TOBAC
MMKENGFRGDEAIGEAACTYFHNIFTETGGAIREDLLSCIPSLITAEDNEILTKGSHLGRTQRIADFLNVVLDFSGGATMPKFMISACSVLLPKVEFPNSFTEYRPISLSNFLNKIISKLDMAKAYDRVSWGFTCIMLRKMGINEMIIDMIWRTMSNNWYSVIINDTRCGFFHSTRGMKQGDPLAPSLFIIRAELLYRVLNNMSHD